MTQINKEGIEAALGRIRDPYTEGDLVSAGAIQRIEQGKSGLEIDVVLGYPASRNADAVAGRVCEAVAGLHDGDCTVSVRSEIASHAVQRNLKPLPGIKNVIAVASGKGGVGKSTVAVNVALALAADGARVGMLDADIYGPSQPTMLGIADARPTSPDGKSITPLSAHGIVCMSIGFLVDPNQPMVWRGPMVTQALTQLIGETQWGELDYLIVDMPPGTGDTQLTMSQRVPLSGAIIVTTPQEIALLDARKGLAMFEKVEVAVLGVVENMSEYHCPKCGHAEPLFGYGGGERLAGETGTAFLGAVPLERAIREQVDGGCPSVAADPDGAAARAYTRIARRAAARLSQAGREYRQLFPNIVVEST